VSIERSVPAIQLSIRAVPNAGRDACAGLMDDGTTWKIRIAAPAVDGRANDALIAFMAKTLNVPRPCVSLTAGASSRSKRVRVEGVTMEEAAARLAGARKM
jgi:uncharacterized protein (TIGR00251 family)